MIRLLIAASSPVVRAGLESLAVSSPGITVVGVEPDLAAAEALRPDVVLTDLPVEDLAPAPAIVLLSAAAPMGWTPELLRTGVRAVLSSRASPGEIVAAIESAAAGFAVIDPQELEPLLSGGGSRTHAPAPQPLTPRELDVLRMLAEGAANKTIAWKLDISEHTVKFHVASIMSKLDAGSRTEAVTIGIRQGLILI